MNIAEAKKIDLVEYLASLGYHPAKLKRADYWYCSPLREEKTPSFKVNRKQNVWYDHGLGKGGNFVDFAMLYHNCSVKELLGKINNGLSFHQRPVVAMAPEEPLIKIIAENNLSSLSLLRYLKQRRIAESIAKKYCQEVVFSLHEKRYAAIGFKNNEGGFELRNQCFKGSSSPKGITSFENSSKELEVFEGFFNFLSHQTIHQNQSLSPSNILVLNSTSFFEKSRQLMEKHDSIRLFLDRDTGGQKCTAQALSWGKKYKDESSLYKGYNDLNEWQQQIGKSMKKALKQT
jgi:DNA primase